METEPHHPHGNPALNPIFAGGVPTLPSTSSAPRSAPRKPSVPPAVGRIIGELGLRYRPSAQADLEAHALALRLLIEDVADVPPHLLEAAAKRWAQESPFMPKASDLIAYAKGQLSGEVRGTDAGERQLLAHCERLNAMKIDWRWEVSGTAPNRQVIRTR